MIVSPQVKLRRKINNYLPEWWPGGLWRRGVWSPQTEDAPCDGVRWGAARSAQLSRAMAREGWKPWLKSPASPSARRTLCGPKAARGAAVATIAAGRQSATEAAPSLRAGGRRAPLAEAGEHII